MEVRITPVADWGVHIPSKDSWNGNPFLGELVILEGCNGQTGIRSESQSS